MTAAASRDHPFEPIHTGRLSDRVYDSLRQRILRGELETGRRLVEGELARQLTVSQAPVRDALRRLAHEGLVVQVPRRGTFVASTDESEQRRAYDLRAVLEPFVAREFCHQADDSMLTRLKEALERMQAAAAADDTAALIEADIAFHGGVYEGANHALVSRIWPMMENTIRTFTSFSNLVYYRDLNEIADTHVPLLAALRKRDGDQSAVVRTACTRRVEKD